MTKIAISAGHGKYVSGAVGPAPWGLNEFNENCNVVKKVGELLQGAGIAFAGPFIDETSRSQNENLNTIVNWHNRQSRDLDISVHFNSSNPTTSALGTEVLYVTQQSLSARVSQAIATVPPWPDRGAKYRSDLFFLNNTSKPAILIEVCFVSSQSDASKYHEHFDDICLKIAESITGQSIQPGPAPEPEPEPEPEPGEPGRVEITASGNVMVLVNGQQVYAPQPGPAPAPSPPSYQTGIIATVFNGNGLPGAYGIPIPGPSSPAKYLALPWKDQALKNRKVRIIGPKAADIGEIWDLGPWFIDDNYPALQARPLAEQCWQRGTPCPRGPNKGIVPNGAGIDLSPALAKAVGIDGKGRVDWEWVDEGTV